MDNNENPQVIMLAPVWPTPPPPSRTGKNIFSGRFGLRAGWGIAIYIALFALISFSLTAAIRVARGKPAFPKHTQSAPAKAGEKTPSPNMNPGATTRDDGSAFLAIAFVTWILSRIERRRMGVYGIGRTRLWDFLPGAFWGLATLSLLVGVLRAMHVLVFDGRVLFGFPIFIFAVKWLLAFLFVGFAEEYINRGYLQYTLTRGLIGLGEKISATHGRAIAFWMAAVVMSCLFGAGHLGNPGETTPGIIAVFVAGMVFSYTLWYTGSLWWGIGFHMAWDWAQSFLYGVADSGLMSGGRLFNTHATGNPLLSGGTTGPEGSIFVIPAFLMIVLVVRFSPRGAQPALEPRTATESLPPEATPVIA